MVCGWVCTHCVCPSAPLAAATAMSDDRVAAAHAAMAAGRYEEALVELDRAIFVRVEDGPLYAARAAVFTAVSDFQVC